MREPVDLTVLPTPDQLARFRALSPEERFRWFAGLLRTTYGLAPPAARESWRAHKQAQSGGFVSVVCAFVRALEGADRDEASRCLGPVVTYDSGSSTLRGGEAILSAYAAWRAWITEALDGVRFRSRVEAVRPGVVVVTFEDHLEHRGRKHRYRRQQEMAVGRSKQIETIVDRAIEGQEEALDTFLLAVNVVRPRATPDER